MSTAPAIPTVTLSGGVEIPQLGFGLFKVDAAEAQRVTEDALEAGYRHLDTAAFYGNEEAVGQAIAASGIPRDELFITTKLWSTDHGRDRARAAFDLSLSKLGLDAVDLFLIHWPAPPLGLYRETWATLQEFKAEGRSREVGVSNFLRAHLEELIADGPTPAVNQIEVQPGNQQKELRAFQAEHGIAVEAYSPLARGRAVADERLAAVAEAHGKSIPQVILRWHLQQGSIVIPKTVTPARMRENLDVFDFELEADALALLDGFDEQTRLGSDPATFTGGA